MHNIDHPGRGGLICPVGGSEQGPIELFTMKKAILGAKRGQKGHFWTLNGTQTTTSAAKVGDYPTKITAGQGYTFKTKSTSRGEGREELQNYLTLFTV